MKFRTESGSHYEIDRTKRQIRRIAGPNAPSKRQGKDGEWKHYEFASDVVVGNQVVIFWDNSEKLLDGSPPGAHPTTMTSPVAEVEDDPTLVWVQGIH